MKMSAEEEHLIKRVASKSDQKAFERLFFVYYDNLYRFAYTYLKNKEEAEEIVSDVFVRLWEQREKLLEIRNLEIYLIIATKNHALNRLKKFRKVFFTDIEGIAEAKPGYADNPEQQMLTYELASLIDEAVLALPEKCRRIFQLVRMEGMKQKEVARMMHLSPRTVENQIGIALKKIAGKLAIHLKSGRSKKSKKAGLAIVILSILTLSIIF